MKKEQILYRGIVCDSNEERYFLMWAVELHKYGYISSIDRATSYTLADKVAVPLQKPTKTGFKQLSQHLLHDKVYTPDFDVIFTEKGMKLFVDIIGDGNKLTKPLLTTSDMGNNVIIEVKPKFNQNGKTDVFAICQKWLYQKHGIIANKVIPQDLFAETFTPTDYLLTDKSGKPRKLGKVITINEFLNKVK